MTGVLHTAKINAIEGVKIFFFWQACRMEKKKQTNKANVYLYWNYTNVGTSLSQ